MNPVFRPSTTMPDRPSEAGQPPLLAGANAAVDWSDVALARTWRSGGALALVFGVGLYLAVSWVAGVAMLVLALWAFAKSDVHLRERLVQEGRMTRQGKAVACLGLLASALLTLLLVGLKPLAWAMAAALVGMGAFVASRSEAGAA